jgi:hypothetical protein
VSLAHLPVLAASGAFGLLVLTGSNPKPWRRVLGTTAILVFIVLLLCAVCAWLTGCNLLQVWKMNLANHAAFYQQSPRTWWKWVLVNPLELSFSVGLPLMFWCLTGLLRAIQMLRNADNRRSLNNVAFPRLVISLTTTWVILWLSGKNMGEAARLWCFLTPWIVITAAMNFLPEDPPGAMADPVEVRSSSADRTRWVLLLLAQLIVCAATVGRVSGYHMFES